MWVSIARIFRPLFPSVARRAYGGDETLSSARTFVNAQAQGCCGAGIPPAFGRVRKGATGDFRSGSYGTRARASPAFSGSGEATICGASRLARVRGLAVIPPLPSVHRRRDTSNRLGDCARQIASRRWTSLSLGLRPNPELAPASSSTGSDESLLISSWRRGSLGPRSVISSWQGVSFNRQSVVSSWQFVSFRRQSVVSSWQRLSFNRRSVVSSWQRLSFNRRSVVSSWQRLSFNRQSVVSSWQRVSFRRQSVVSSWQRGSFNRRSVVSSWQRGSFRRQSVVSYWQRLSFNRRSVVSYWQRGSFRRQSVVSYWQRLSFNRRSVVSSWQSVWFGWARVFAHCRSDFSNCRSDGSNWQSVASRRRSVPASSMRRLRDRKVDVSSESRGASVGGAAVPLLLNRGARDFVAWEGDICGGRSAR